MIFFYRTDDDSNKDKSATIIDLLPLSINIAGMGKVANMNPDATHSQDIKVQIILLASGKGQRFSGTVPKVMAGLQGKPVFAHSLDCFLSWKKTRSIHLVVAKNLHKTISEYLHQKNYLVQRAENRRREQHKKKEIPIYIVVGGATRHQSFRYGYQTLLQDIPQDYLFIHDAARPLVKTEQLDLLYKQLSKNRSQIVSLAAPMTNTVAYSKNQKNIDQMAKREQLFQIQTPQALRLSTLMTATNLSLDQEVTENNDYPDLISWGLRHSLSSEFILTESENIKITYTKDLALAHALLERRAKLTQDQEEELDK